MGGYQPYPRTSSSWQKYFAWLPVRVNGKTTWLKTVYRKRSKIRLTLKGMHTTWIYGTIFDVLKEPVPEVEEYDRHGGQIWPVGPRGIQGPDPIIGIKGERGPSCP